MISLKRYLDAENTNSNSKGEESSSMPCAPLLLAYRSALAQIGECGAETCPAHGAELKGAIVKIDASIGEHPSAQEIAAAESGISELLQTWGKKAASYYEQKADEVKDLLLVMARTAESLGNKDDRYVQQLDAVTAKLETIATLDDVSKIRASVEESARELRKSLSRMTAENKTVIDHLRAEVSTYQTKLERAEHVAACDALTGLGSRPWIEERILQRIEAGSPFSILILDIDGFRRVNDEHGKLVGDHLLREFARELRSTCRFSDLVARWGGDRFIVLVDSPASEAQTQAARLHSRISKPYHVPGKTGYANVGMEASIAVADYREGDGLNDLLERADAQLVKRRADGDERLTA